jgi:hypothetical protein
MPTPKTSMPVSPPSENCSPSRLTRAKALSSPNYSNSSLGEIAVSTSGASTIFDFGEWKSEVASRKNPDGTISFVTTAPRRYGF